MSPTIKDIAERANVSMMTVSRVINDSGSVASDTRERVERIIEELDYRPNLIARSLLNRRSAIVYVIVPDIANPFYAELTRGVEMVARDFGYNLIVSSAHWNEDLECEQIEAALGRMAEAIILVLPRVSEKRIQDYQGRIPLVVVDRHIRSRNIDSIYIQQDRGAAIAVDHLISLGHRRIAFISGPETIYNSVARCRGYQRALTNHSIDIEPSYIIKGDFSFESGQRAYYQIREIDPSIRPTAVFAASDLMALGFMRSAFIHNMRIPDDMSLVGFDDISLSSMTNPPLTTVRHPFIKMGREAMSHVLRKLEPSADIPPGLILENSLHIRETTRTIH